MKIPFVKMHGLGNDFVIILEDKLPANADLVSFASKISNRTTGIGCDQFITYNPCGPEIQMSIYNPDGTNALACGNASRCLSRLIFDHTKQRNITLNINGRKVECQYTDPNNIKVSMGEVQFLSHWMPNTDQLWQVAQQYMIEPKEMLCVDVANPHLVIFTKLSKKDQALIGRHFQNTDLFPDGINVNFATVQDDKIHLRVMERGVGFTQACGSGAVASFAAANKLGFVNQSASVVFAMGELKLSNYPHNITMCGPASYVFDGEYSYE